MYRNRIVIIVNAEREEAGRGGGGAGRGGGGAGRGGGGAGRGGRGAGKGSKCIQQCGWVCAPPSAAPRARTSVNRQLSGRVVPVSLEGRVQHS